MPCCTGITSNRMENKNRETPYERYKARTDAEDDISYPIQEYESLLRNEFRPAPPKGQGRPVISNFACKGNRLQHQRCTNSRTYDMGIDTIVDTTIQQTKPYYSSHSSHVACKDVSQIWI
jgi:hypothetical protein